MRTLFFLSPIALAACMGPAPPPPGAPYELASNAGCIATRFEDGSAGDAAALDRLTGVYAAGRQSIVVSRQGGRFLAHRVSMGVRDLTRDGPDGLTFRDGCNQRYTFDGGAWLTISAANGSSSRWRRRNHE